MGKITGPRTYYLIEGFAKLEQALIKYTVDNLIEKGFELMSVPDLVHPAVVVGYEVCFPWIQWAPLNSASKYAEELAPIKWYAQLAMGQIKRGPLYLNVFVLCTGFKTPLSLL